MNARNRLPAQGAKWGGRAFITRRLASCLRPTELGFGLWVLLASVVFGAGVRVAWSAEPSGEGPANEHVIYEVSRFQSYDDERWPAVLFAAGAIAFVAIVWQLYRRDAVELGRGTRLCVIGLRILALVGLVVFFLGIERRTAREIVNNSQVAVLVDVSQSMGLAESESGEGRTRLDVAAKLLVESPLLGELSKKHDVNIARFDKDVQPIASLPKSPQQEDDRSGERKPEGASREVAGVKAPPDWAAELQPRGAQTRLGQAVADQLRFYREAPLAGVVVISDGAQNAGIDPRAAVEAAKGAKVPVFTIGVGSAAMQRNVAIRDLMAPTRAFPNDTLNVVGYLQANGFANRTVEVELVRRGAKDPEGSGSVIATERVALATDGELTPVSFEVDPGQAGTFVFQLRLTPPPEDGNPRDNQRDAEIEIVDRKTRVLLFASGPMRDYQFLRNQLHRDDTMIVDVLLQTAQAGISQDANKILDHFPNTPAELYEYDCLVAFDPDWTRLDAAQIELVEKWVSQEAGGLIAVAGPVEMPKWIRSAELGKVRDMYPVVFQNRLTLLDEEHTGGDTPWPLAFERAGREAKFLWLEKTAGDSERVWDEFTGVYGCFAVKGPKPGATVYARYSNPEAGTSNERPPYLVGQFYGAGLVFYLGSGELWRLRRVESGYFESLTTKLVRHVSQGRILRGSPRGALLVERDRYELGESVIVRARLSDAQHKPLTEDQVTAQMLRPDGTTEPVRLAAEAERPGMYLGQVTVLQEGTHQLALALPGSGEEPLSRYLQVRVPDLERTHAERNDKLLSQVASETGGYYYQEPSAAIQGRGDLPSLAEAIRSRAEVKVVKGAPDKQFAQAQMKALLALIAGSLFVEWIVRRLNRLA
ncbi:MAG: VWA domain-containing protein [Pirellulales bacterium]|nr:VWA domain-containing protein [Pirellulales bacterium]